MKIRNGFVSNSSSSSFLIAAKNRDELKVKITYEADLSDFVEEEVKHEGFIDNADLLVDLIEDGDINSEELKNLFKEGYKIYQGSLSDEEPGIETILCWGGLKITDFSGKILYSKGGY